MTVLSRPLAHIFNIFLKTNCIPAILKQSFVVPIYKNKGSKCDPGNYRPISFTCSISRIFEYVIRKQLVSILGPTISPNHHGFYRSRSTLTNLLSSYTQLWSNINERRPVDMILFDFSRAFDKVDHKILLKKT